MCSHFAKPKRTLPKRVLPNHATVFTVAGGETRNNWSMIREVRLGISEQPLRAGRQVNEHCGNNTQSYDGLCFGMYALTDKFMQPSTQNCPYFFFFTHTHHSPTKERTGKMALRAWLIQLRRAVHDGGQASDERRRIMAGNSQSRSS